MPINIQELIIRANVTSEHEGNSSAKPLNDDSKKIQRLLDEMLKKIKNKNER